MERYQKFRKEFPRFYYHGYKTEENELVYKITYGRVTKIQAAGVN